MTKDSTREPAGEPGVRCVTFVLAATEGGTGVHVRSLAAGLAGRGVEVTVAGPAGTERVFGFTGPGARFVPVEVSDRPRPGRDIAAVAALRRLLPPPGAAGRAAGPAGGPGTLPAPGRRAGP